MDRKMNRFEIIFLISIRRMRITVERVCYEIGMKTAVFTKYSGHLVDCSCVIVQSSFVVVVV